MNNTYKDSVHGIIVSCKSKNTAWMMIRNVCHERNLIVPKINEIRKVFYCHDFDLGGKERCQFQCKGCKEWF